MVQFITHFTERYSYLDSVKIALEGGCRWVQLRMKNADEQTMRRTAEEAMAFGLIDQIVQRVYFSM